MDFFDREKRKDFREFRKYIKRLERSGRLHKLYPPNAKTDNSIQPKKKYE